MVGGGRPNLVLAPGLGLLYFNRTDLVQLGLAWNGPGMDLEWTWNGPGMDLEWTWNGPGQKVEKGSVLQYKYKEKGGWCRG